MKKAKIIKTKEKEEKKVVDESYSIKTLFIIILVLLIVFAVFYFITTLVVKPSKNNYDTNNTPDVIDNDKITLNSLFRMNADEYYVLATKESLYNSVLNQVNYIEIYDNYIINYKRTENSLPFYYVNLDDALNKNYLSEELNISDDLSKLKINDEVLFKISKGKIIESYVGHKEIVEVLSKLV